MRATFVVGLAAALMASGCGGGEETAADASVVDTSCLGDLAWYGANSGGSVQQVAQKQANALGLYDVLGNVSEWVSDCYHETYAGAPSDGTSWDETSCSYRVLRGGSFGNDLSALRLSGREGVTANFYGASVPGVRCARAVGAASAGSVTLEWVSIAGGSLTMGCSSDDSECAANESPAHSVTVASFEMTKTEVTEDAYYTQTALDPCKGCVTACPTCAASYISWDNAKAFCEAVGGRLPTEAEWEFAARGGVTSAYPSCN